MSKDDKNVFDAIKQWRLMYTVEHSGIDDAVKRYGFEEPEVKELVLKAIQDHHDIIKSHQDSIASLKKCMEEEEKKDPTMEPKSGDVLCYICGKNGHKAKECCGVGCYKCGKVGHIGRIMSRCNGDVNGDMEGFVGHYSAICYYCGKGGYIAVCSKCGETGHMGKECC
ncbi:DNA-binding protein HEXBP [Tanacetum coccineum]